MKKEIPSKSKIKIGKFIDPLTDFGFKCLFGNLQNKELLIDLLNALLKGRKVIKDLTFNKNERLGPRSKSRNMIFDLLCTGPDGEQFIIEIQRTLQHFFKDRAIYYTSRLINDQAPKKKRWDYSLKEVYFIGLMNFHFDDSDEGEYLHPVLLAYEKTGKVFYEKLQYLFVEIPKFKKTEKQLSSRLDKWIFVLKNLGRLEKIPVILKNSIFLKLFKAAAVSNLTKEELMKYEEDLMAAWDEYAIKEAREAEKKAMREEGKAEGRAEGREEGREEGMEKKSFEVVKNLVTKMGMTNEQVSDIASVSIDFVKKVRRKLKK